MQFPETDRAVPKTDRAVPKLTVQFRKLTVQFRKLTVHWWPSEPRNEARYEPVLVYEARTPEGGLRGSYQGSYEARIRGSYRHSRTRLVYEAHIRTCEARIRA